MWMLCKLDYVIDVRDLFSNKGNSNKPDENSEFSLSDLEYSDSQNKNNLQNSRESACHKIYGHFQGNINNQFENKDINEKKSGYVNIASFQSTVLQQDSGNIQANKQNHKTDEKFDTLNDILKSVQASECRLNDLPSQLSNAEENKSLTSIT